MKIGELSFEIDRERERENESKFMICLKLLYYF